MNVLSIDRDNIHIQLIDNKKERSVEREIQSICREREREREREIAREIQSIDKDKTNDHFSGKER
jgi:hypothetical protein